MDVKVGDTVHVRGVVLGVEPRRVRISFIEGDTCWSWFDRDVIVHVEPRPLKVGDRVEWRKHKDPTYKLLGIDGDRGWIKREGTSYDYSAPLLAELTRLD